ncbi:MAG: methyltransferase domain-containing protein [Bryobacteraceae bacterium]
MRTEQTHPALQWQRFARAIPADLRGRTVLDIGCGSGFFSIEMKRRGADRVVAIDLDDHALSQARSAAEANRVSLEMHNLSVYDVARLGERFDVVLFIDVLAGLRYPLLALDLLQQHAVKDIFVFQTILRGPGEAESPAHDYPLSETAVFERPGFPATYFIENCYGGRHDICWIPNEACTAAMLRSAGFVILERPDEEVFLCRRACDRG